MIRSSHILCLALGAFVATAAAAQTPTTAQQEAIRSNCAGDFRKLCSGVPAGGKPALECLEKNVNSLSSACQTAVKAVEPASKPSESTAAPAASAPATESEAPAASSGTQAPAAAANQPPISLRQELRLAAGACAIDFRLFCPNLPIGHGNILFCLQVHSKRLAPACHEALAKAGVPLN